ncbi:hypothetical protein DMC01_04675 [Campylobacter troglodytis]|nr:hypothetical protein DMC01_04675 [Campylobacter troglodytis]
MLKAKISQINGLEVQNYYDDWYIYGIFTYNIGFYNIAFGLLKLRENEHYLQIAKNKKDFSDSAVAISFISFDMEKFIQCLSLKDGYNIGKIIDYPIVISTNKKQYNESLRSYFANAQSVGGYFIAELYINKVLKENNFANPISLSPLVKKDKRIQKFLESENLRQSKMIYDSKSNVIYISNPHKWSLQDKISF